MTTPTTLLLTVLGLFIYFLPAWIGAGKRNATAIFWLNLLLGWSIIGWVVAIVWATSKDAAPVQVVAQQVPGAKSMAEELERLQQLREAGHLTDEEFQQAKAKVIG